MNLQRLINWFTKREHLRLENQHLYLQIKNLERRICDQRATARFTHDRYTDTLRMNEILEKHVGLLRTEISERVDELVALNKKLKAKKKAK